MAEAADQLLNHYTYYVVEPDSEEKRKSRETLGRMVAPIITQVSDEMIKAGISIWSEYETERDKCKGSDSSIEVSSKVDEQSNEQTV